jgi:hypothetical protein
VVAKFKMSKNNENQAVKNQLKNMTLNVRIKCYKFLNVGNNLKISKKHKKWALIKKHGFSAFTHGFAAAQRTRIPRLHAVSYLIFLWVNF